MPHPEYCLHCGHVTATTASRCPFCAAEVDDFGHCPTCREPVAGRYDCAVCGESRAAARAPSVPWAALTMLALLEDVFGAGARRRSMERTVPLPTFDEDTADDLPFRS
jgi:predicted amidophosphoribosyltransferase